MASFMLGTVFSAFLYLRMPYSIINKKKIIVGVCSIALIGSFFVGGMLITQNREIRQHYDIERIKLLSSAYDMWNDHKWLGVGLKNWGKEYHETYIRPDAREPNLLQARQRAWHIYYML